MKKIAVISLMCCLLVTVAGYQVIYSIRIAEAKSAMKDFLRHTKDHQDLTRLVLTAQQFAQYKEDGEAELKIDGQWYDIVDAQPLGDQVFVRCIADEKESALVKAYQQTNREQTPAGNAAQVLLKLMATPFELPQPVPHHFSLILPQQHFAAYTCNLTSMTDDILIPPPRVC